MSDEPLVIEAVVKVEEISDEAKGTAVGLIRTIEEEIDKWWNDARANLGAVETEVHNKLHGTKEALKARLRALIG